MSLPNTGAGGSRYGSTTTGSNATDGIVMIRYSKQFQDPTSITGTYTTWVDGVYKYYKFTSNNTITF
jgi:hypothetical protein